MKQKIEKEIVRNILLNPGPSTTSLRVKSSLIQPDQCPREQEVSDLMIGIKSKLLKLANPNSQSKVTTHDVVLLSCSGTGAVEAGLSSCIDRNQKILILQNGAYGRRMAEICDSLCLNYDIINFKATEVIDAIALDKYLDQHYSRYDVVAFVHHETTTGLLNDLSKIHSVIKKYNLISLVDCMSSFAGIPIDLQVDNVDYLITVSNKCIHAMAGIGVVIVSRSELARIANLKTNNYYFNLSKNYQYQNETNQFLYTPPVQILYALNTALDELIEQGGVFARYENYSKIYNYLINGMQELGFKTLINSKWHSRILTSFLEPQIPGFDFIKMHDFLKNKGITIYPGKMDDTKCFRIANIGDLTEIDMKHFLSILDDYLQSI